MWDRFVKVFLYSINENVFAPLIIAPCDTWFWVLQMQSVEFTEHNYSLNSENYNNKKNPGKTVMFLRPHFRATLRNVFTLDFENKVRYNIRTFSHNINLQCYEKKTLTITQKARLLK